MDKMYRIFLIVFLFKGAAPVIAQQPSFIHYGVENGLPSNLVYTMTQDKDGFLWFGTDKGLARFDGTRFHVFDMSDGLPDIEILDVESDSRGRLWISPFKQNPCYRENGVFHTAQTDSVLQKIQLHSSFFDFQEDNSGRIWMFGGDRQAYCLDGTKGEKIEFSQTPRHLFQIENQDYIITLGLVLKVDQHRKPQIAIDLNGLVDTSKLHTVSGANVLKDQILICVTGKLILLKYTNGGFLVQDTLNGYVGQVYTTKSGDFAITNYNQGALLFDCSKGRITLKKRLLPDKKVNMLFEDNQGILWLCTPDEGVYAIPENAPLNYVSNFAPYSHNITSLSAMPDKSIVAGNDEGGIFILKNNRLQYKNLGAVNGNNRVLKTIPYGNGRMFIATDENLYNLDNGVLETFKYTSTPKSIVYTGDTLWGAFSKNLGYFIPPHKTFNAIIETRRFTSIEAEENGVIWAGGMDGIYSSADSFIYNWGDLFPDLKTRIITLLRAEPGFLWVSTPNQGLLRVATSNGKVLGVEQINEHIDKPILNVKTIYTDIHGSLWMGTNKGVYMLRKDFSYIHFDKHDGLVDDDINTLLIQDDTIWVGTTKGLTRMSFGTEQGDGTFPTYVAGVEYRLNEKKISVPFLNDYHQERHISISPEAGMIEISLAGLDYGSRGNVQFEYVQQEQYPPVKWITFNNLVSLLFTPEKKEKATISEGTLNLGTRLKPGKYAFEFTAVNTRGDKSTRPDRLFLIQQPYWYETLWFWLAIWMIIVLVLRKIYKDRMAYRDLNASVSKLRLQALQAQMNPHFIGNSIYAIQQFFYPPDPEKASEYIELFNRLLRQSMLMSEHHFVPFRDDLNYYLDYLNMIQLRFGNRFSYQVTGAGEIPPNTPFPAMILQPIIENATIHGLAADGNSHLTISFARHGSTLECHVEDNGEGIQTTQERARQRGVKRKSKGLELLYQKVNTLNRLYNLDLQLNITDLSQTDPALHGTRASLVYDLAKISSQVILNDIHP